MATKRSEVTFTVKEFESGQPWIALEILRGDVTPKDLGGLVGFDLKQGTSLEDAKEIARYLREKIERISLTP